MNLLKEDAQWKERVSVWLGPDARLIHVSNYSGDVRIYRLDERVLKVRRLTPGAVSNRQNTLEDELRLLRILDDRGGSQWGVPKAVHYIYEPGWEAVEMTAVEPPLLRDPVVFPAKETIREKLLVMKAVWSLNWIGLSHGDVTASNVGKNKEGRVVVIDFDQAICAHPLRCFLRDFLGIPYKAKAAQFTVLDRLGRLGPVALLTRGLRAIRRLLGSKTTDERERAGNIRERAQCRDDASLLLLAECWQEASLSGANSPGFGVAYYSLDVAGLHFPGERPWSLRWDVISRAVSFRGKRVVELGCNMGLLSIHARLSGAEAVVGADYNQRVLNAAMKAADVFGAEVTFRKIDFDNDDDWEEALGAGDLVTALSLTYWLHDKERLWRYLASFSEVIFEGHEATEDTEQRFRLKGFSAVHRL